MTSFAGFEERWVDGADGVRLRVRVGGECPPVVLLHGHPRTHTTWHRVAPLLAAAGHSVVFPDLRGYGRSSKPVPAPDELNALLGMAQAQGFLTQETDHIASSVQVDAGQVRLNGKTMQMPQLGGAQ